MLNGGKEDGQGWWRTERERERDRERERERQRDDPMLETHTSDNAIVHPKFYILLLFMH